MLQVQRSQIRARLKHSPAKCLENSCMNDLLNDALTLNEVMYGD